MAEFRIGANQESDKWPDLIPIFQYSKLLATLADADEEFVAYIASFTQLHDIGKFKVAEMIRIPRELTSDEFEMVKKHPSDGAKMVKGLEGLEMAYDIIMDHLKNGTTQDIHRAKKAKKFPWPAE